MSFHALFHPSLAIRVLFFENERDQYDYQVFAIEYSNWLNVDELMNTKEQWGEDSVFCGNQIHGRTQRERGWPPRGETNAVTRGAAPSQSPPPTLRLPSLRLPACSRWQLSDSTGGLVRCGAWKPLGPTDLSCAGPGLC